MIRQLLLSVVAPAVFALMVFCIAWRPWRRAKLPVNGLFAAPIALAGAFWISFFFEEGVPELPPRQRWEWLPVLAGVAALLGLVNVLFRKPEWIRWTIAPLLAASAGLMLRLPGMDSAPARIGVGAAVLATLIAMNPIAKDRTGATMPMAMMIIFAALSAVILKAGFAKLALMTGALSASCGAALAIALLNPNAGVARGGTVVLAALLPTLALAGVAYDYAELSRWCFALPALAPLMLWLGEAPIVTNRKSWQAVIVRGLLVAIPCLIAVALASAGGGEDSGYGDYSGY